MKNTQMTPRQFCRFALLFPHCSPEQIAGWVKDECRPLMADITDAAMEMANGLTPGLETLPTHCFLYELSEWAGNQATGKAVHA